MDHLEALKRLQDSDVAIHKLRARIEEVRKSPDASFTGVKKLESLVTRARADHLEARKKLELGEGEVVDLQAKKKQLQDKLSKAATPRAAEAAQLEIVKLEERLAGLEEQVLGLMEREDEAAGMLRQTEDALRRLQAKAAGEKQVVPGKVEALETEIRQHEKARDDFRGKVVEDDLARYDQLSKRFKGRVVVEVEESCPGCDASFTEGQVQELLRNRERVQNCPACGRLVIFVGVERL